MIRGDQRSRRAFRSHHAPRDVLRPLLLRRVVGAVVVNSSFSAGRNDHESAKARKNAGVVTRPGAARLDTVCFFPQVLKASSEEPSLALRVSVSGRGAF
jgi:hypothetical protein